MSEASVRGLILRAAMRFKAQGRPVFSARELHQNIKNRDAETSSPALAQLVMLMTAERWLLRHTTGWSLARTPTAEQLRQLRKKSNYAQAVQCSACNSWYWDTAVHHHEKKASKS